MDNSTSRQTASGRSSLPTFLGRTTLSAKKHLEIRRTPSFERSTVVPNGGSRGAATSIPVPESPTTANPLRSFRRSQIPRPPSSQGQHANVMSNGKYMPLGEALRRSPMDSESEESSARGSPSPAPRDHRDGIRARDFKSQFSKIPLNRRPTSRQSMGGPVRENDSPPSSAGIYEGGRSRLRQPTQYGTDRELLRKASNSSLGATRRFSSWGVKGELDPNFKKRLMSPEPTDEVHPPDADIPIPSIETAPVRHSPEKSFAWYSEADFTEGNLQVSDSPPVRVQAQTKLGLEDLKSFQPLLRSNKKIDEIRRLENELVLEDMVDEAAQDVREPEAAPLGSRMPLTERTNTRLDDIRVKEMASLSKKQLAMEKLDQIRTRNSKSRSLSPEATLRFTGEQPLESTKRTLWTGRSVQEGYREPVADKPVAVFHKERRQSFGGRLAANKDHQEPETLSRPTSYASKDSHELLKRLARATSSSPSQEKQDAKPEEPQQEPVRNMEISTSAPSANARIRNERSRNGAYASENKDELASRPSSEEAKVSSGSDGSHANRPASPSGVSSKRSSTTWESTDPADRIKSEMNLFAPRGDDQSEPGVGFPEGTLDGPDAAAEQTPRATRQDPLTMPTPKAPGAYVETPATIRVEHVGVRNRAKAPSLGEASVSKRPQSPPVAEKSKVRDDSDVGLSSSVSAGQPTKLRTRSMSRSRPPLFNSAKLPSAKDDLREIQRKHQTEDDTLDDFAALLHDSTDSDDDDDHRDDDRRRHGSDEKQGADQPKSPRREREAQHGPGARNDNIKVEEDLEGLGKSVHRALLEVQDSKKGIERLLEAAEATAADAATKGAILERLDALERSTKTSTSSPAKGGGDPVVRGVKATTQYATSWLWTRRGRPSWLAKVLLAALIWLLCEAALCHTYCRPVSCMPGQDCTWSPADPFPGYALPVKLDQWATGGLGRAFFARAAEEVGDLLDEAADAVLGREPTERDTRLMSWDERRRYRRRLEKRGLVRKWAPPDEYTARFAEWAEARRSRERASNYREMGYDLGDGLGGDSIKHDEKVS